MNPSLIRIHKSENRSVHPVHLSGATADSVWRVTHIAHNIVHITPEEGNYSEGMEHVIGDSL